MASSVSGTTRALIGRCFCLPLTRAFSPVCRHSSVGTRESRLVSEVSSLLETVLDVLPYLNPNTGRRQITKTYADVRIQSRDCPLRASRRKGECSPLFITSEPQCCENGDDGNKGALDKGRNVRDLEAFLS